MLINFRKKPDLAFAKIPHTELTDEKYCHSSISWCQDKKLAENISLFKKMLKLN